MVVIPEIVITASRIPEIVVTAPRIPQPKAETPSDLINADQFYLEKIELITTSQIISLSSIMVELSYYEDIMNSSMTGEVLINDAESIIDRFAMTGSEYVRMEFKKTKQANISFFKYFRVYRVSERLLDNNYTELYKLHLCSEELFLSEQKKISKSYPGKEIHNIVKDILLNELKIPRGKVIVDNTKGIYDFIIPYKKPFEAINWLANYAQPEKALGADFLFFENRNGFNFLSLQTLYSQPAYREYRYDMRNTESSTETIRSLNGIKSYTFLDTFDSLYGTSTGAFSNSVLTIDPLTRRYTTTNYNYLSNFNNYKHLNKQPVIPTITNRDNINANESYNSVLKVLTTNANQKTAEGIKDIPFAVSNDVGVETYVPHRTSQLAMAHYSRIKMSVSGDPGLTVGQVINVTLPSLKNRDGSSLQQGQKDEIHSGNYIITAVRHVVDSYLKYETVLEIAKESHPKSVRGFEDTDSKNIQNSVRIDAQ
jgi:hypothetical protein